MASVFKSVWFWVVVILIVVIIVFIWGDWNYKSSNALGSGSFLGSIPYAIPGENFDLGSGYAIPYGFSAGDGQNSAYTSSAGSFTGLFGS